MSTTTQAKQQAYRFGLWAEWVCILRLWLSGHRILARRMRNPFGEIDLIAKRANIIVFIEVKARQSLEDGLHALSTQQQQRIMKSASSWLASHPKYAGLDMRFDLMVVTNPFRVRTIKHAFEG